MAINIVICGGHLAPALAITETLQKNKKYQIYYFGRKHALEGDPAESLEYRTMAKLHIPFKAITSARLQRVFTWYTVLSIFKFPIGLTQSFLLLLAIRPKIVISFGGYLALPVCLCASLLRIPIITHEQTHSLGLSNKIISRFAQVLCLSYKDTVGISVGVKTVLVGNPIRESLFTGKNEDRKIIDFGNRKLPLIYITGGSVGSRSINLVIGKILSSLITTFRVLHQCGNADGEADFKNLSQLRDSLPRNYQKNYKIISQVDPASIGTVYRNASLIIGRAGANTVTEILAFGKPSILIPLPWAGHNEQEKNALMVKMVGLGEIVDQSKLTPKFLFDKINSLIANIDSYRRNAVNAKKLIRLDGVGQIVKLIDAYCG